jgi:hypothetical protein
VNAAFLLVTSALLVGQGGDKHPAPPPLAPAAVASSGCCAQDPCGCEGYGHRLRDKLRGLFKRDNCDSCQPTTCHTPHVHHVRTPACAPACEPACKPACPAPCHAPATSCDSCERTGFLTKLRERFHRGDSCCDGGCSSGCGSACGGTTIAPAKTGERIDTAPKKMPDAPGKKTSGEVRLETQSAPYAPNSIQVAPTAPSVEIAPLQGPAPRVEGDRRDPF